MNTNTPTLFITTGETMRQQWDEYSKVVPTTSPEYEMLWESWYQKTNTKHDDPNIVILKEFIEDTKKTKLCLENYTSKERATMHVLCDKIGLYHKSTGKKRPVDDCELRNHLFGCGILLKQTLAHHS